MAKTFVAEIDDEVMSSKTSPSDRFVYSNYFVPILLTFPDGETPILPFYQKKTIVDGMRYGMPHPDQFAGALQTLGLDKLWELNGMREATLAGAPAADAAG